MVNRWANREEPKPGRGHLYWHILLGDQPDVRAVVSIAQEKLVGFSGLHFTPQRWLHITTLVVGPADNFTSNQIAEMTSQAYQLLSEIPPISITLSRILYHPEAIVLEAEPGGVLDPVRKAVKNATCRATGKDEANEHLPWHPHVTLAYSIAVQSSNPIIAALGRRLPTCKADIKSISLIAQEGAERRWSWHRIAEVPISAE